MPERTQAQNNGECALPDTFRFLALFGWKFHLDEDEELVITPPPKATSNERVLDVLMQCRKRLKEDVLFKAKQERRQFLGGPLNGKSHHAYGWSKPGIVVNLSRGRWVAYRLERDGRAFYLGEATNKKKANQLIYASLPKSSVHRAPDPPEQLDQGWKDSYGDDDE